MVSGFAPIFLCSLFAQAPAPQAPQTHWSFVPPSRPSVPAIQNPNSKIQNPLDAFIVQKLNAQCLTLNPPADRRTIIRRITFDLTGLPPTPEEIAAFVADRAPDAYPKVVRRLLASPRFGERWAQHWLDVVRWAESNGYEHDDDRPQAWRYRDWVVEALNADMPYDRFLREQIAGDLIAPNDFASNVATGFLRAGPYHITGGNLDPTEMRQEWLAEAVSGIGNGVLGLTIGCARCHDHKYDHIPQADYYRLQAFFASTANGDKPRATADEKKWYDDAVKAVKERIKPIEAEVAAIEKPYRERLHAQKVDRLPSDVKAALGVEEGKRTPEQKKLASQAGTLLAISWDEVVNALSPQDRAKRASLRQQMFALERQMPEPLTESEGVGDTLQPRPAMHVLVRGDVHHRGPEVTPGVPACLAGSVSAPDRLALADWLTSSTNPLTARVMVNRVWQHLFGRGLVATPNDFGKNGQRPTNPELLDWLACEFVEGERGKTQGASDQSGAIQNPKSKIQKPSWSLKRLIELIVLSDTYRQSGAYDEKKAAIDPDNRLFWRMNRKRLDAEALRDSVLAVAGTLNLQMGGPSVRVALEPEVYDTIFSESEPDNLWSPTPDVRQHTRRSLYLFRKRNVRLPMMAVFDQPDMMSSCAARGQTVHALQALTLVNGEFMRKESAALAGRLFRERPASQRARIERLFELTLGRPPNPTEERATERFLADAALIAQPGRSHEGIPQGASPPVFVATADLCLSTLNLNDFLFVR